MKLQAMDINGWTYFLLLHVLLFAYGYDQEDVKRLKKKIFEDSRYDKSIRPLLNQSKAIQVNIGLSMMHIVAFDMANAKLETTGYILSSWKDENLVWNATDYGGITKLNLDNDEVWVPGIVQMNTVGERFSVSSAFVENDGRVIYHIFGEFGTFCDLNIRFYPNDKHSCDLNLLSSKYTSDELTLIPLRDHVDLANLREHGEWNIKTSKVFKGIIKDEYLNIAIDQITHSLTLERMPIFNVIHKCAPLMLIMLANMSVHGIPVLSGERISYSVTVLLAFVFWQALVTEELPQNSTKISLLSIMMTMAMAASTVTVMVSIMLSRLAVEKYRPIPRHLRNVTAKRIRNRLKLKKSKKEISTALDLLLEHRVNRRKLETSNKEISTTPDSSLEHGVNRRNNLTRIRNVYKMNTNNEQGQQEIRGFQNTNINDVKVTWLDAADTLDIAAGTINTIASLIVWVVFVFLFVYE